MTTKLLNNILHTPDYNTGGVSRIYLLDVDDFVSYQFEGNQLYDKVLVEKMKVRSSDYITLDIVDETEFSENYANGIYKQELKTFVRTIDHSKTASLLAMQNRNYVVFFGSNDGLYTFGSDGGASVSFNQQTGQMRGVAGYNLTIHKDSIYPLFEVDEARLNRIDVLGAESLEAIVTEIGKLIQV